MIKKSDCSNYSNKCCVPKCLQYNDYRNNNTNKCVKCGKNTTNYEYEEARPCVSKCSQHTDNSNNTDRCKICGKNATCYEYDEMNSCDNIHECDKCNICCCPGEKGDKGTKGDTGTTGSKGEK